MIPRIMTSERDPRGCSESCHRELAPTPAHHLPCHLGSPRDSGKQREAPQAQLWDGCSACPKGHPTPTVFPEPRVNRPAWGCISCPFPSVVTHSPGIHVCSLRYSGHLLTLKVLPTMEAPCDPAVGTDGQAAVTRILTWLCGLRSLHDKAALLRC